MLINQPVGIVSFGSCLPRLAVPVAEIEAANQQAGVAKALGVTQKTVPEVDEDSLTLATEASAQAFDRLAHLNSNHGKSEEKSKSRVGAVFVGSESHPYAVKPTGTMLKQALGLPEQIALADLQFACKAGTQAVQIGLAYSLSGLADYILAVGVDTAQAKPGDALEYTAGAGAAALVIGHGPVVAHALSTCSIATDTPDFWRRPAAPFPEHAGRFSGEPGYFYHVTAATKHLLAETGLKPSDIDYCVFHTPNAKFPVQTALKLGFTMDQIAPSLVVKKIGNTYAAASLLGLIAVLEQAQPGQKILMTSYGSGAGSDSFLFETTPLLMQAQQAQLITLAQQIEQLQPINYQKYYQLKYVLGGH